MASCEPDSGTFDLNLINNEVFFANTAYDYMVIEELSAELPKNLADPARRKTWMAEFLTRRGALTDPDGWLGSGRSVRTVLPSRA
ncbi:hypothetical protein [Streptomyces sp. NPDC052015]|uniref:hypothetical protein n=1 Tax=Streptomyces sp. NPDC052015 TaxID=3154755 RepID=UPI00342EE159